MSRGVYRFCLSALLYWACTVYDGRLFVLPDEVIHLSVFLPPILGLMWGPLAAAGVYVGSVFSMPEVLGLFFGADASQDLRLVPLRCLWVFLAAYLPCFLWHKWRLPPGEPPFSLQTGTLGKLLLIFLLTFLATSVLRMLTATEAELSATGGWLGLARALRGVEFVAACFLNDFVVAIFFGIVWFFFLVSNDYGFYCRTGEKAEEGHQKGSTQQIWWVALSFYACFPLLFAYLDVFQLYGLDSMKVWLQFVAECLLMMDVVLVMMIYLLLRYRHSIMMEIVFLVAMAVFFSAAVLGWGSSMAMGQMVAKDVNDSLRAMSVICRERLDRTFFCVRQSVSGMEQQAVTAAESYDRLVGDEEYRNAYIERMSKGFSAIAMSTDGCIACYMRFSPKIAGPKGGFSMVREEIRWEGALPSFVPREPIDLSLYSSDDMKNVGWYYIPRRIGHATWIEPYIDPTAKNYVISYVSPLYIDGYYVGVVGVDIDFGFIIQELRRMSIYDYGYTYIMNRNGMVLYHRDIPQGSMFQSNPDFREMEIYLTNGMWLGIAMPVSKVHDGQNHVMMHLVATILVVAMLVSLISIALVSRAILPLLGVTEAAEKIAAGDLNVNLSYNSPNELGTLVRSIREMAAKLEVYVYRDKLTGLRNAAAYMSKGAELDERRRRGDDLQYGVIIFDANFLKRTNDQYGHQAGNELLRHAAQVICRVFDHSPVYRIGGDEFAAILEHQDYEQREALLRRFDEEVAEEKFDAAGHKLPLSVARGLAVYEKGMEYSAVAKRADAAMYNHKTALKTAMGVGLGR